MHIRTMRLRSIVYACALLAVVMTLAIPATAFAADAKFYYKKPAPNSTTTTATPKIAVYIVDRYGIRYTSNFRLYLDGVRKTPKISYKSRYKKVWIAYYPKTPLAAGQHKVVVKVKNVKGHWSTTTWYFKVPPPPEPPGPFAPPPMPITVEARNCHACHLDTSWHPMTDCQACHGVGRPVSWSAYTPDDESAHTASCAGEQQCHGGSDAFPHVLWKDCTTCHNGAYSGISSSHAIEAEPAHASTSVLCTKSGCHVASLTAEHYRHSIGGVKLSCATCHSSTSLRIRFAVRSGSTRCESCHSLTAAHSAPASAHTGSAPSTCTGTGCHNGTPISVHSAPGGPGCAACHTGGGTASLVCATCHPGDVAAVHVSATASHAAANPTCISSLCHASDVAAVHSDPDGPGCVACHAAGKTPGTACAICHPGTIETLHPNVGPAHTAPVGGCVTSACHKTDVTEIHGAVDGPGCGACHKPGARLTIACTSCHAGDIEQVHPGLTLKHTESAGLCTMSGCHGTRAATVHSAVGGPGCAACHAEGKTPSTSCAAFLFGDAHV